MNRDVEEIQLFVPWFLLSEQQRDELKALPLWHRWKFHRKNKKYMDQLKIYRKFNPYKCFTVKLVTKIENEKK